MTETFHLVVEHFAGSSLHLDQCGLCQAIASNVWGGGGISGAWLPSNSKRVNPFQPMGFLLACGIACGMLAPHRVTPLKFILHMHIVKEASVVVSCVSFSKLFFLSSALYCILLSPLPPQFNLTSLSSCARLYHCFYLPAALVNFLTCVVFWMEHTYLKIQWAREEHGPGLLRSE